MGLFFSANIPTPVAANTGEVISTRLYATILTTDPDEEADAKIYVIPNSTIETA